VLLKLGVVVERDGASDTNEMDPLNVSFQVVKSVVDTIKLFSLSLTVQCSWSVYTCRQPPKIATL
jgi:hypothetical protein